MPIYDRQLNPIFPQLRLPSPPSYQFGAAVAAFKGLALFEHFHPPKQPDPATAVRFIIGAVTNLHVKDPNPGFISSTDALITDTSGTGLQTCLHKLITTQFQNFLGSKQNKVSSGSDRLRVALVDLSGNKTTQPDFAGWGSPG